MCKAVSAPEQLYEVWNVLHPEPKEGSVFFFVIESKRCNYWSFNLEGIFSHASDHWNSKKYTEVEGLWIFIRLISYPLENMCLSKAYTMNESCTSNL